MAPPRQLTKTGKKKRNRKARTEVSSSSSSSEEISSDSDSSPERPKVTTSTKPKSIKPNDTDAIAPLASSSDDEAPADSVLPPRQPTQSEEQVFEAFYLKQATREFADDLEKLRSASDWKGQRSVDVLVGALKQGAGGFGKEKADGRKA